MKKKIVMMMAAMMVCASFTACKYSGRYEDVINTKQASDILQTNQPTPTDIDYSLERYNLIRRAYWVNGQREKANSLVCEIEKPLGYIVLFTENGSVIGRFVVDGKVSSLNSFLTPDSEAYSSSYSEWYAVIKERNRMCDFYKSCKIKGCPAENLSCDSLEEIAIQGFKLIRDVEQWSKEHPQKTMLQDFLEKFPKAKLETGCPPCCPRIYGYTSKNDDNNFCPGHTCIECWNRPMEG